MRRIRSKDTVPELVVRRLAHSLGYRYRLHAAKLPGKPDMGFPTRRKVIFVHGCFWHQHPACRDGRNPSSNIGYWTPKLQRNVQRDADVRARLMADGWDSLVIRECETADPQTLREKLVAFLRA